MKYYIKVFLIIFLISFVSENCIKLIVSHFCEAISYYCVLISPVFILISVVFFSVLAYFFSSSKFYLRLFLLYFFSSLLGSFFYDFFPYRYLGYGSISINWGMFNKALSILYILGAIISGFYFYNFKPLLQDLIFLIFYFFVGVLIMFMHLDEALNLFIHFIIG